MQITFYSFLSAALWCSVLILFTHLLWTRRKTDSFTGAAIALYAVAVIRMMLPLDFTVAAVIPAERLYPIVYEWMMDSPSERISVAEILLAVWLAGACVLVIRYIADYWKTIRRMEREAMPAGERVRTMLREVSGSTGRLPAVDILPSISSPYGIGIFRKRILIPEEDYSDDELSCILRHEYTHFKHHDIVFKQVVILFCMFFWWNPVVHLLKSDIEQLTELRCDAAVTRDMSRKEKTIYLGTIVRALQGKPEHSPYSAATLTAAQAADNLKERFRAVMQPRRSRGDALKTRIILICYAFLILFSYATILQPSIDAPPSTEEGAVDYDATNSYIMHNKAGEFWLHIENREPMMIGESDAYFYRNIGFTIKEE